MESSYVAITWETKYDGYIVQRSNTEDGEKWIDSMAIEYP